MDKKMMIGAALVVLSLMIAVPIFANQNTGDEDTGILLEEGTILDPSQENTEYHITEDTLVNNVSVYAHYIEIDGDRFNVSAADQSNIVYVYFHGWIDDDSTFDFYMECQVDNQVQVELGGMNISQGYSIQHHDEDEVHGYYDSISNSTGVIDYSAILEGGNRTAVHVEENKPPVILDATPKDGKTQLSTSPRLAIKYEDPNGEPVEIRFYRQSENIANVTAKDGLGAYRWEDLQFGYRYYWNFTVDDGIHQINSTDRDFVTEYYQTEWSGENPPQFTPGVRWDWNYDQLLMYTFFGAVAAVIIWILTTRW